MSNVVEIVTGPAPRVEVTLSSAGTVEVLEGRRGPAGPAGPDSLAAIEEHITDSRPHEAAESGRDFAAWFTAQITT